MNSLIRLTIFSIALSCFAERTVHAEGSNNASNAECQELGFTGTQLCSDCARLGEYVKDQELVAECRQCCMNEDRADQTKYSTGFLEVCRYNIVSYPHIEEFIDKKLEAFPNLNVRYRLGAAPRLYLQAGKKRDAIRIDHWKTEEIVEYIKDRLEPQAASKK